MKSLLIFYKESVTMEIEDYYDRKQMIPREMKQGVWKLMKVASMFSGIGGIDLAFQTAGFDIVWSNEKDAAACKTYRYNFPSTNLIEGDIRNIDANAIPSFDVLVAGFPCQSFSTAGFQKGFKDPRGNLFFEIIRVIKVHKPKIVFLENVENIIEHDKQKTFLRIFNELAECGYDVKYKTMQPLEYAGVPQRRKRIFIIAFKSLELCDQFSYPDKCDNQKTIFDIIDFSKKQHSVYYYNDSYANFGNLVSSVHKGKIYSIRDNGTLYCSGKICPTLIAGMGKFPERIPIVMDDYGIRKLTVRECLRFQGFPETYRISRDVAIEDAYKQIGNTVCVPVVQRIAEEIMKILK